MPVHFPSFPLVGREAELRVARAELDAATHGHGRMLLLVGAAGVGKTRVARAILEEAARREWLTAAGHAFAVEKGVPYALFADALLPTLKRLDPDTLTVLTRGVGELAHLFPGVFPADARTDAGLADFPNRLAWHFTEFLRGFARRTPLLVVLEDLHWADASSLELLHFMARQTRDVPLLLVGTYNSERLAENSVLAHMIASLQSLDAIEARTIEPLTLAETNELLERAFDADPIVTRDFAALLYGWTRGNAFFLEETLKALIASGDLCIEHGRWSGWAVESLRLPSSVRDAVRVRLEPLSARARQITEIGVVLGSRFDFDVLRAVVAGDESELLNALDELRRLGVLDERADAHGIAYDFAHPIVRETIYAELGLTRAAILHGKVAESLEEFYGNAVDRHVDELAYHFARAPASRAAEKAVRYLIEAGTRALTKNANREAADYLTTALERMDEAADAELRMQLIDQLARALQRLGEFERALELWSEARDYAERHAQPARLAATARRMGLACFWSGRHEEALGHLDAGLAAIGERSERRLRVELEIASAMCLHELGRSDAALERLEGTLDLASGESDDALLARVHRAFLLIHLMLGDSLRARSHAEAALRHGLRCGDQNVELAAQLASAQLAAFSGDVGAFETHLRESERLAATLRSPLNRLLIAEMNVQYAQARGDWDTAVQLGEHAISLARALRQRLLLPRLLVWTGLLHLARGAIERGRAYVDEAWQLAGRGDPARASVHSVLTAYAGQAGLALATGDYEGAISTGEAGIALADRTGNVMWSVHCLLPVVAEAYLWVRDLDGAARAGSRLRHDAERLGHRLGLAWADACDALVAWLAGDTERGAVLLRTAAEGLEAIPFLADATRLRRQLAGRLADLGDREGALRELREVHDRLARLGAGPELAKARIQFRELGARPPAVAGAAATGELTGREVEIARMVADRKSSKAIARHLGISVRTVDAHLTNIFRKLGISSRTDLADHVRAH